MKNNPTKVGLILSVYLLLLLTGSNLLVAQTDSTQLKRSQLINDWWYAAYNQVYAGQAAAAIPFVQSIDSLCQLTGDTLERVSALTFGSFVYSQTDSLEKELLNLEQAKQLLEEHFNTQA